mmetsp:Transcript_16224/g.47382  ORF Transcript_16224/g.47382 Transcript_16224/m.47382 type:complete len:207 (+) Transcript_16224:346-966(+)
MVAVIAQCIKRRCSKSVTVMPLRARDHAETLWLSMRRQRQLFFTVVISRNGDKSASEREVEVGSDVFRQPRARARRLRLPAQNPGVVDGRRARGGGGRGGGARRHAHAHRVGALGQGQGPDQLPPRVAQQGREGRVLAQLGLRAGQRGRSTGPRGHQGAASGHISLSQRSDLEVYEPQGKVGRQAPGRCHLRGRGGSGCKPPRRGV